MQSLKKIHAWAQMKVPLLKRNGSNDTSLIECLQGIKTGLEHFFQGNNGVFLPASL